MASQQYDSPQVKPPVGEGGQERRDLARGARGLDALVRGLLAHPERAHTEGVHGRVALGDEEPKGVELGDESEKLGGVGAFAACMAGLKAVRGDRIIGQRLAGGRPVLGICVGMQILFDESEEFGRVQGLGILPGRIVRFAPDPEGKRKVPQMGWNTLKRAPGRPCPLLKYCSPEPFVYFVHSYYPVAAVRDVYATTTYGVEFASVVGHDAIFGVQFHPEKSQQEGIGLLRAFGEFVTQTAHSVRL